MGFLGKLFGLGAAAGAAAVAVKVAQRYEENKNVQAAQATEEETQPVEETTVVEDVVKAAGEVCSETAGKVKAAVTGAAQKAGVDTDEVAAALSGAGKALADAGKAVVASVKEEVPEVLEKVKTKAEETVQQVKDTVAGVTEDAEPIVYPTSDSVKEAIDAVAAEDAPEMTADEEKPEV